MIVVTADALRRQIASIFTSWGMAPEHVETAVHVMVETDLRGIDSHGIGMIPTYMTWYKEGRLNVRPDIRIVRERDSLALIDADESLGHPPSMLAIQTAVRKAKATGIGVVGVRNSNHYGAAGFYAQWAAEQGCIGMCMTASSPLLVPTFGTEPRLGTNPIAFAAPAMANKPFSLDMATTTVAFGKINIARRAGKKMPEGWALDETGQPLTDSQRGYELRRMTPLGGSRELGSHKGYGLAAMVEILCSTLTGSWIANIDPETGEQGKRGRIGHFFLSIDPHKFRDDDEFEEDMDRLMSMLRATPPADPSQPVLVAGDPEHASHVERSRSGIPMTQTLWDEVRGVAEGSGVPFILGN